MTDQTQGTLRHTISEQTFQNLQALTRHLNWSEPFTDVVQQYGNTVIAVRGVNGTVARSADPIAAIYADLTRDVGYQDQQHAGLLADVKSLDGISFTAEYRVYSENDDAAVEILNIQALGEQGVPSGVLSNLEYWVGLLPGNRGYVMTFRPEHATARALHAALIAEAARVAQDAADARKHIQDVFTACGVPLPGATP